MNEIQKAVSIIGNQSDLARMLKLTPQAVQKWCKTGYVPIKHVLAIEKLTNGKVTRYELRPDIYADNHPHTNAA